MCVLCMQVPLGENVYINLKINLILLCVIVDPCKTIVNYLFILSSLSFHLSSFPEEQHSIRYRQKFFGHITVFYVISNDTVPFFVFILLHLQYYFRRSNQKENLWVIRMYFFTRQGQLALVQSSTQFIKLGLAMLVEGPEKLQGVSQDQVTVIGHSNSWTYHVGTVYILVTILLYFVPAHIPILPNVHYFSML